MTTRTAWMLLAISLVFVALGVLILVRGGPEDRAMAIGGVAFFGACAVVGAFQLLPKRKLVPDAQGVVTLTPDPLQQVGLIIGATAMSVGCWFIAPLAAADGEDVASLVSWFGVFFFGLGAPIGLWRLLRPNPQARLDGEGVQAFGPTGWRLSWRDITGIGVVIIKSQRFLAFDSTQHSPATLSDRTSDALGVPRHMLSVIGSAARFEDLHAIALSFWEKHRAK
jgi:hypothetical protein